MASRKVLQAEPMSEYMNPEAIPIRLIKLLYMNNIGQETILDNLEINHELTEDQKTIQKYIPIPDNLDIEINESESVSRDVLEMNQAFELSQYLYKEVLSPELKENEELKRTQKRELMTKLFKVIKWQFICTYISVSVIIIIIGASSFLSLSSDIVEKIITFMKFYITTIVGELIAILFFIVKNVFDTSIVELIKNFDKRKSNKKDTN